MTKNNEPSTDIPEAYSVKKWDAYSEVDGSYGVRDELIPEVAGNILETLDQMGIDRSRVLFSGYSADSPKETTEHWQEGAMLGDLAEEMSHLDANGEFDANPSLRQEYLDRLNELKEARSKHAGTFTYFLTGWEGLYKTGEEGDINPIKYAETEGAVVGVYDRNILNQVTSADTNEVGSVSVQASPEQMEQAKVLDFHPRYNTDDRVLSHT